MQVLLKFRSLYDHMAATGYRQIRLLICLATNYYLYFYKQHSSNNNHFIITNAAIFSEY